MVTEFREFRCDICNCRYKTELEAQECQNIGFVDPKIVPGMVFKKEEEVVYATLILEKIRSDPNIRHKGHFPHYRSLRFDLENCVGHNHSGFEESIVDDIRNLSNLTVVEFKHARAIFECCDASEFYPSKRPYPILYGIIPNFFSKVDLLEQKLRLAVKIEDYEKAAKIRDQIVSIKSLNL
jgi:hypothetical protein